MPDNRPADPAFIEDVIGPRGNVKCDSSNRVLFRRWITAKGWGADFAAVLSIRELNIAYNSPGKGGGEPGKDAWLDKRLREFKQRQAEAGGAIEANQQVQQAMDLGADLPHPYQPGRINMDVDEGHADAARIAEREPMNGDPMDMGDAEALAAEAAAEDMRQAAEAVRRRRPDENDPDKPLEQKLQDDLDDILNIPKSPKQAAADKADELAKMIRDLVADKPAEIDPAKIAEFVDQKVKEALEKAQGYNPREIVVKKDGDIIGKVEGRTPPWFERVLKLLQQGENVLLVGPPGCGKSHNARLLAQAMGVDFGMIHGSAGASESQLTGWLLPIGEGGKFVYVPSDFVKKYEQGKTLFCLDELDAFDPNMMVSSNGATANGHFYVPHRYENPCVVRGENAMIMATANTYGTGGNLMFAGRNAMDATTLDRYVIIDVDYDIALEKDIAEQGGLSEDEANSLWALRRKTREASLRRVISTRAFQKAVSMKAVGDSWETITNTLLAGWTRDERAKVGA